MFDQSSTWQRLCGNRRRPRFGEAWRPVTLSGREIQLGEHREHALRVHLGHVPEVLEEPEADRRGQRIAMALAVVFHLVLLVVTVPEGRPRELTYDGPARPLHLVQNVRFQAPPSAPAAAPAARKRKVKRVPIPDPTPDAPEPIRELDVEFDLEELEVDDVMFDLPPAPRPTYGRGTSGYGPGRIGFGDGDGDGPYLLTGDIEKPVRIFSTPVRYTEEARKAGVQGVVILEAIITAEGDVDDVRVVLGQPLGLTENAIESVLQWKYEPATKDGKPVPVIMAVTISFQVQ